MLPGTEVAGIGDRMTRPTWQFIIVGTATGLYAVTMGALLCLAPQRFVAVYRRVILRDYAPPTIKWQRAVESPQGRVLGALMFVFGCLMLWIIHFHRS